MTQTRRDNGFKGAVISAAGMGWEEPSHTWHSKKVYDSGLWLQVLVCKSSLVPFPSLQLNRSETTFVTKVWSHLKTAEQDSFLTQTQESGCCKGKNRSGDTGFKAIPNLVGHWCWGWPRGKESFKESNGCRSGWNSILATYPPHIWVLSILPPAFAGPRIKRDYLDFCLIFWSYSIVSGIADSELEFCRDFARASVMDRSCSLLRNSPDPVV